MGTEFQRRVWEAIGLIPRGRVTTYGEIARFLGRPRAVRAVGTAVGKNPYAPKVPCHRVVRSDGSIGNYSGGEGTTTKIAMLKEEGVEVSKGRIVDFARKLYRFGNQQVTSPSGN
ncbi:methylated-DNA--[protein]-cysteine S-methyltransferase [Nitratifractor sp.]